MSSFNSLTQPLSGCHSIEASAGTGKTHSITILWLRLIVEQELRVDEILVSTFTKAATAELKERLLASLRKATTAAVKLCSGGSIDNSDEAQVISTNAASPLLVQRLNQALSAFDLAPICTMHGFCQSLIARHAFELGCDSNLSLVEDPNAFLQPLVDDQLMRSSTLPDLKISELRAVANAVASHPAARVSESSSPNGLMAASIQKAFPAAKTAAGVHTFDDLLLTVRDALSRQPENGPLASAVRARLRAAIIDECQDSDGTQIEVFARLFQHPDTRSFIVIGDPKQSIYRFRGADLASYKALSSKSRAAAQMRKNYRSDAPLINALNALYEGFVFPDAVVQSAPSARTEYIPVNAAAEVARITDPAGLAPMVFQWTPNDERGPAKNQLAAMVATECARLLSGGVCVEDRHNRQMRPIEPGDIAILAADRHELATLRRQLSRLNIPTQSSKLGTVFATDEAGDVLAWLELFSALEEGGDVLRHLLAFLGTPLGSFSADALESLRSDTALQATLCGAFRSQIASLRRSGPLPILLQHIAKSEVASTNLAFAEGERRLTNWRQIASLLQHEHGRGRRDARSLGRWLSRLIANDASASSDSDDTEESALLKLETDRSTVQLSTIHASKGLEYPVVFCPFLWHRKSLIMRKRTATTLVREQDAWCLDFKGSPSWEESISTSLAQEDEEEHRRVYVALTRARHRLYIGVAPVNHSKGAHYNGAQSSAFAALPGLGLANIPHEQWRETLARFSHGCILEAGGPQRAGIEREARSTTVTPLLKPESNAPYSFPLLRTVSFTTLSKLGGDSHEQLEPTDRDLPDSPPNDESSKRSEKDDLLKSLGKGGVTLGDQLHRILERYLGNKIDLPEAVGPIASHEAWRAVLNTILDTQISLPSLSDTTLRSVRASCITEMQFHLPIARFNTEALATALLADPQIASNPERASWARRLAESQNQAEFAGFLQGFIDLIFEHEGRWFIADYKSNTLPDYSGEELENAMLSSKYLLQARLYALALHRHLQVHLEHYDFEKHFGGIVYIFVRGFPESGVWSERPSLAALNALGSLFLTHPA